MNTNELRSLANELSISITYHAQSILHEAADEIDRLTAERDALRADAARWAWFAKSITGNVDYAAFEKTMEKAFAHLQGADTCSLSELNAAIDAAMKGKL